MPDFDLDQWLDENGYSNPGDISEDMSDYTQTVSDENSNQFEQPWGEAVIWNIGSALTGAGADSISMAMYNWTQSYPQTTEGWTDEQFATQLFITMFNNAEEVQQQEFVDTWNETFEFEISDGDLVPWLGGGSDGGTLGTNIEEAAEYWGTIYGAALGGWGTEGDFFASGNSLTEFFGEMTANIVNATGEYNAQYGEDAWAALEGQAEGIEEDFNLQSQALVDSLLGTLEGIDIQAGGVRNSYSLLDQKTKSEQAARGLHKKRKGLADETSLDLQQLSHQITALDSAAQGAEDAEVLEQDLLNLQWDDTLTDMFMNWQSQADIGFQDLIFDIDNFVDTYNNALISDVDFQTSQIWTAIQGIISQGGIAPPPSGGWDNLGSFMCITSVGGWGMPCPPDSDNPGLCTMNMSECYNDPSSPPPESTPPSEDSDLNDVFPETEETETTDFELTDLDEEDTGGG